MKSAMARSFAVLCIASVGALKVNILKSNSSEEIPLNERRTFVALPGNGWCVDASGKESTARTKSLRMSCAAAQRMCAQDDMCVAFACVESLQMAVLYTSTNCVLGCDVMKWLIHPDAIASSGYDSHVLEMAPWKNGSCFVDERSRHGSLIHDRKDTIDCDFEEDTCGWTLKGIYKWRNSQTTAMGTETGPRAAYSGVGFLVAAASSALYQNKTFEVISPFLGQEAPAGKQSLMTFWYSMDGAAMGDLEFWCDTPDGRKMLWSKQGNQGPEWKQAMVEVPATQCRFLGKTGGLTSDIAIDDVKFEQKVANLSCNFDAGLCDSWTVATTGWMRNRDGSDSGNTGPTNGAGGADSWYMYVEASGANSNGKTFELNSRTFLTHENTTLRFKYNMHGVNMGTLQVRAVMSNDTLLTPNPFERVGEQNADPAQWSDAEVPLPAGVKQIKFVGTTGAGGDKSDMAIDDVEFTFNPEY